MRKIILSLVTIAGVIALGIGASQAFFSDSETSTGNLFQAGAIDLKVDNTSYVTNSLGVLVASHATTWNQRDLTVEKFFNFSDVKPGDIGEDTISLHVNNNDAYLCAAARVTENSDVDCTDPEYADDTSCGTGNSLTNGDLAQQMNFAFWADDGDNVYEQGEQIFLSGPISGIGNAGQIALADSTHNIWTGSGPIAGGQTKYIGKAWCFGTLTTNAATQDGGNTGTPLTRATTGFNCNGVNLNNAAQTDRVLGDIQFYTVQSRNNSQFNCSTNYTPNWNPVNRTVVVGVNDLVSGDRIAVAASHSDKWFMYNDTNDTIDNNLGSFVTGPATPPFGVNSIAFLLGASPMDRKNIATYKFSGLVLSNITSMSFGAYSHGGSGGAGPNESPYLHFNVDFNGSDTWQSRLVYVPSANGSVPQDTWNTYNVIQGGAAKWVYSGAVWPTPLVGPHAGMVGVSGTTPRTWDEILADYPGVRVRATDSWLGIRVGEPGPTGYTGNVDFFAVGTSGGTTTYNFE